MEHDPARETLRRLLRQTGIPMREASLAMGRNANYLQQFLRRGSPATLRRRDREVLARLLGCTPADLWPNEPVGTVAQEVPADGGTPPAAGTPLATVPEVEVTASAGGGAITGENPPEVARWRLPDAMLRHEGGAFPENLRILRARGDSMEPLVGEGDRLIVDISRRAPATGELAVLWDGLGLVVKRVEAVSGSDPAELRLISANPVYEPYAVPTQDVHMIGKVVWVLRKA
ncbi:MAG: peptidase S24 [Rhodospirillales bacterium]|nr:peptidase S24 [Rhodospirillales bacterium]